MNSHERSLLESLDRLLKSEAVRSRIAPVVERVSQKLAHDQTATMAWEPIPLSAYGVSLPAGIQSSWVFILRAGATTGAERHPNSHQRMISYRGTGDFQTGGPGRWQSNPLVSADGARLEERWISIPPNVWHQAVVPAEDWVVVSFHTVPAEELIEERPDAADPEQTRQRRYLAPAGWFAQVPVLTGRWVRLEPLAESHREGIRGAADDERIWKHTLVAARGDGFDPWFEYVLSLAQSGRQVPFAVRRLADATLVGSTSFLDPSEHHKRVEIRSTWYNPAVWGSVVNAECKLLLLAHAFDVLGVNRVAFVTDVRNERSQAAIAKLGAVREGVCRAHMISQGGRIRDSVLFSIIAPEWPAVRERLAARVADE
jgi:RimJ/RimL family protein N-acetyltransferase